MDEYTEGLRIEVSGTPVRLDLTQMAVRAHLRFIVQAVVVELLFLADNQRMSLNELRQQAASALTMSDDADGDVSIALAVLLKSGNVGVRDDLVWLANCEGMHADVHPDVAVPALFYTIPLYLRTYGKSTRNMLAYAMLWRGFTLAQTRQAIDRIADNGLVTVNGDWVELPPRSE